MFYFCSVWAGARAPPKHLEKKQKNRKTREKKKKNTHTHTRPNSKKNTRPRPFRACLFFAVWACGCVYLFAAWAFFLAVWAGGRVFFGCLGGGVFFFCCLGGCRVYSFAVWAVGLFFCCLRGGREFTHLPVCLARLQATQQQKRPNSKRKHGFQTTVDTKNPA